MTYACKDCGFLFRRVGEVERCPYCDSDRLRPADEEERERLEEHIKEECLHGGHICTSGR